MVISERARPSWLPKRGILPVCPLAQPAVIRALLSRRVTARLDLEISGKFQAERITFPFSWLESRLGKVPGFSSLQSDARLLSLCTAGLGVAPWLGTLPKLCSPYTVRGLASLAKDPLFNKGSRDPVREKESFQG